MSDSNYFNELNKIDVNDKIEKKNNLTYLSWAWAWAEVKKRHQFANYKIYEREDGRIYWDDGRTAWVKTGVIIEFGNFSIEHIEYLPVMDFRNTSIPVEKITSFDVNKAIQRSLTKAVARHGLGLYIYAGEDLPDAENKQPDPKYASMEQVHELYNLEVDVGALMEHYKIESELEIPLKIYKEQVAFKKAGK